MALSRQSARGQDASALVYPWRQRRVRYPAYFNPLRIGNWKTLFRDWLDHHHDHKVYVTIDIDCLVSGEAITNWENGRFTCDDLVWALRTLREKVEVIGGDLCGGWSRPLSRRRSKSSPAGSTIPLAHEPNRQDLRLQQSRHAGTALARVDRWSSA